MTGDGRKRSPVDAAVAPTTDRNSRLAHYLRILLHDEQRLVVASNRGPLTFKHSRGGAWHAGRGSGGLVTALAELGRLAPVTWVSAAMEQADRDAARLLDRGDGRERDELLARIDEQLPGQDLRLVMRDMPADAWQQHYGVVANPFLWFMQHQLYTLPYEPTIDDALVSAWQNGYRPVNRAFADAIVEETRADARPVVLLQDYHLYLAARYIRERRPDALLLHFNHIPWPSVDSWLVLPQALRRAICEGLLANDIVGLPDRPLRHELPGHGRRLRARRAGGSGRAATSAGAAGRSGCAPTRSRSIPTR